MRYLKKIFESFDIPGVKEMTTNDFYKFFGKMEAISCDSEDLNKMPIIKSRSNNFKFNFDLSTNSHEFFKYGYQAAFYKKFKNINIIEVTFIYSLIGKLMKFENDYWIFKIFNKDEYYLMDSLNDLEETLLLIKDEKGF